LRRRGRLFGLDGLAANHQQQANKQGQSTAQCNDVHDNLLAKTNLHHVIADHSASVIKQTCAILAPQKGAGVDFAPFGGA
jgi:hypothetical protein